jgi:hypothetical protein
MNRSKYLMQRRIMLITECRLQRATLLAQGILLKTKIKSGNDYLIRFKKIPSWAKALLTAAVILVIPKHIRKLARLGLIWQFWRSIKPD